MWTRKILKTGLKVFHYLYRYLVLKLRSRWKNVFVVVAIALGLEGYVSYFERELTTDPEGTIVIATATTSLIMISRGWRLVRVTHAVYKEAHDFYQREISTLETKVEALQVRLREMNQDENDY